MSLKIMGSRNNKRNNILFRLILFSFSLLTTSQLLAQSPITSSIELQGIGTSNGVVPFWLRSNQFGNIPVQGLSAAAVGSVYKDYSADNISGKDKKIDWAFGFQGRGNAGEKSNLLLIEAYAKIRVNIFELKVGRSKDTMGFGGFQALSSGNFALSGNALGIPKIELSIPEYFTLPILDGALAFKGQFTHGWVGRTEVADQGPHPERRYFPNTYFHQKSLYGRFGKQDSRLKMRKTYMAMISPLIISTLSFMCFLERFMIILEK
jgi:hypothetical protein